MAVVRRLASALALVPILALSGCDDDPICELLVDASGGYTGTLAWSLSGTDSCGFGNPTNVDPTGSVIAFVNTQESVPQYFYILPAVPAPTLGTFAGRVLFIVGDNIWDSGANACTIQISQADIENWTLVDFYSIAGIASCSTPLVSASPDVDDVTLGALAFAGHIHAEIKAYDYL